MALPPIVDAHIHLWSPQRTPRLVSPVVKVAGWSRSLTHRLLNLAFPRDAIDFVGKVDHVAADFLPADYRTDAQALPLTGVVHVEAGWVARKPAQVADETAWLHTLEGTDLIRAIVGAANLASPDLDAQLDAHQAASARFVGVRDKLASSPHKGVMEWATAPDLLSLPAWRRGFARLGERGLSFDAWMYSPQLPQFRAIAEAHPETRVVLDHVGTPIGLGGPFGGVPEAERKDAIARWRDELAAFAQLPQVYVKLSGLTMPVVGWGLHLREPIDVHTLADLLGPHIRYAIELFGPRRCMFASNFPMDKVSGSLATLYGAFDRITADLDDADRRALFAETALRFYRVDSTVS